MTHLTITVHGRPAAQGSKRHVGHGRMIEMSRYLKPWRTAVTAAAGTTIQALPNPHTYPLDGPLEVEATFTLARPVSHYGTGRNSHILKANAPAWPSSGGALGCDVDKLARACCDALTAAGVWNDDVQVAELTARKTYPGAGIDALDQPGAVIHVRRLADWTTSSSLGGAAS